MVFSPFYSKSNHLEMESGLEKYIDKFEKKTE